MGSGYFYVVYPKTFLEVQIMHNVNPFELIISESFLPLDGEHLHRVIGFEINTGEELELFFGNYGECREFISSVERNALAKLRLIPKLMDKIAELTDEVAYVKDDLREQEMAYDRLLADYDELDHKYQAEVAKNNDVSLCCTGQIDNDLLLKIACGKTSRCDAIRFLVQVFGFDFDNARRYVHRIMAEG